MPRLTVSVRLQLGCRSRQRLAVLVPNPGLAACFQKRVAHLIGVHMRVATCDLVRCNGKLQNALRRLGTASSGA